MVEQTCERVESFVFLVAAGANYCRLLPVGYFWRMSKPSGTRKSLLEVDLVLDFDRKWTIFVDSGSIPRLHPRESSENGRFSSISTA